jgi:hypothetical protein
MQLTRYWVCAHIPVATGKEPKRKEPFAWKGAGFVPSVTGRATSSVMVALIDAPSSIDVQEMVRERFGKEVHFVFMSPKPENWQPPEFKMQH